MKRFTAFIFDGSMKRLTRPAPLAKRYCALASQFVCTTTFLCVQNYVAHVGVSVVRGAVIA
jgi:hypothetical protein